MDIRLPGSSVLGAGAHRRRLAGLGRGDAARHRARRRPARRLVRALHRSAPGPRSRSTRSRRPSRSATAPRSTSRTSPATSASPAAAARDHDRGDQARAPSRRRTRPSGCCGAARRDQQLQRPRRSAHDLSAARSIRQQHLGQRRLRDRRCRRTRRWRSSRSPATSASPTSRAKCAPRPSAATSTSRGTPNVAMAQDDLRRRHRAGHRRADHAGAQHGQRHGARHGPASARARSGLGQRRRAPDRLGRSSACEAKSVSGNIEFDAPLTKGGRYEFTSHSGNVRIMLLGQHRLRARRRHLQRQRPLGRAGDAARRSGQPDGTAARQQPGHSRLLRRRQRLPLDPQPFSGSVVICQRSSWPAPTNCSPRTFNSARALPSLSWHLLA